MCLEPNQAMNVIASREALDYTRSMLVDAAKQVGGYADVHRAVGRFGKDIDTGLAIHAILSKEGRSRVKPGMTNYHP